MLRWYNNRSWLAEVPIKQAFEYYKNIVSYSIRYPKYYGKVEVMDEGTARLETKEFLNLNLDANRDHLSIEVQYQFSEPSEISFKLKGKDFMEGIQGGLKLGPEKFYLNGVITDGTLVSGSISALKVVSLPPGSKDSNQYEEMLLYFGEQDLQHLEGRGHRYSNGQLCNKCGKGQLQPSSQKLLSEIDREIPLNKQQTSIEQFLCSYCGSSFENAFVRLK